MTPTTKQKHVLDQVAYHIKLKGFPPTYSYLARQMGISVGGIRIHLIALRKKGFIDWVENESRSLRLISATTKKD